MMAMAALGHGHTTTISPKYMCNSARTLSHTHAHPQTDGQRRASAIGTEPAVAAVIVDCFFVAAAVTALLLPGGGGGWCCYVYISVVDLCQINTLKRFARPFAYEL